LFLLLILGI